MWHWKSGRENGDRGIQVRQVFRRLEVLCEGNLVPALQERRCKARPKPLGPTVDQGRNIK